MLKNFFTLGHVVALIPALVAGYFGWVFFYGDNGSGSNIVLGICLLIFGIYMIDAYLGSLLDVYLFHGGAPKRAGLLREARYRLAALKHLERSLASQRKKGTVDIALLVKTIADLTASMILVRNSRRADDTPEVQALESVLIQSAKVEQSFVAMQKRIRTTGFASLGGWLLLALGVRAFLIEPYQIPSGSMIPTLLVGDHLFVSKYAYGIPNPFSAKPSYIWRLSEPKVGDVVVFKAPPYVGHNAGESWVKRVIAGPRQRVRLQNGVTFVDGQPLEHVSEERLVHYMDYLMDREGGGLWQETVSVQTEEKMPNVTHSIFMRPIESRFPYENQWPTATQRPLPGLRCNLDECTVEDGYLFVMGDNRGGSLDSRIWGALPIDNVKGRAEFIWISVNGSEKIFTLGQFSLPAFRLERSFTRIH
jgi:signal peptidase I